MEVVNCKHHCLNIVDAVQCRIMQNAVGCGERYAPEPFVIAPPLQHGKWCAFNGDVIVVVYHCSLVTIMKNGDVSIVRKCSNAES